MCTVLKFLLIMNFFGSSIYLQFSTLGAGAKFVEFLLTLFFNKISYPYLEKYTRTAKRYVQSVVYIIIPVGLRFHSGFKKNSLL